MVRTMAQRAAEPSDVEGAAMVKASAVLTPRQLELMRILATGCGFAEASARMGITKQTARNTAATAFKRLEVSGMVQAFVALGWLKVGG